MLCILERFSTAHANLDFIRNQDHLALRQQRQVDLSELETSLVYRASFRTARTTQRNLSHKKNKNKKAKKKKLKLVMSLLPLFPKSDIRGMYHM